MLECPPNVACMLALFGWKQREPEAFEMILIDTPINAQEQNHEKGAHDTPYALGEAENSGDHQLTLTADCFKELIRCWKPSLQRLLEQAAFKPGGQHPGALSRYRLGQLLKITN